MRKLQYPHGRRWPDLAVGGLGAWFALAPWLLDLDRSTGIVATSVSLGLAVFLLASGALLAPGGWEHWAAVAIGLVMAASPWVVGYAGDPLARLNAVAAGIACAGLAAWVLRARRLRRKSVLRSTEEFAY